MMTSREGRSARRRQQGGVRLPALLVLMLVFGAGVLAYRHFFQRPGEAAINLIPSDALMVATLDTSPSPEQAPVFHSIGEALRREHLDTQFDSQITRLLANSPIATQLRPTLANSFAAAALKGASGGTNDAHWALFAALKDPDTARGIIAQYGTLNSRNGLTVYSVPNSNTRMTMIGSYLVIADHPEVFDRILAVSRGEVPSVAGLAEFQAARATLPADSNLMCFVAPQSLREAGSALGPQAPGAMGQDAHWLAVGVALHSHGIDTVMQWPVVTPPAPGGADLGRIAPLDAQLLKRLPGGAYGLMALSQPGRYWSYFSASAGQNAAMRRGIDEGVAQFERETGMSVPNDVLPAFDGDLALAIYHDAGGRADSADGLILIDDAQGADPTALAAKVRDYVTRASGRNGGTPVQFISERQGNATIWSVDPGTQNRMRDAVSGTSPALPEAPTPSVAAISPPNVTASSPNATASTPPDSNPAPAPQAEGAPTAGNPPAANSLPPAAPAPMEPSAAPEPITAPTPATPGDDRTPNIVERGEGAQPATSLQRAVAGKALVWAEIGHAVLIASSRAMLDRAVATFTTGTGALADDPSFAQMSRQTQPGAQSLLMVDLPGIMEALRAPVARFQEGRHPSVTADDLVGLFGHGAGVVGSQRYDGKMVHASFSMPLDYTILIRLLGSLGNAAGGNNLAPARGQSPIF